MEVVIQGCKIVLTESQVSQIAKYKSDIESKCRSWVTLLKFLEFKKVKGYQIYENGNLGLVADLLTDGNITYIMMYGLKSSHYGKAFWETEELKEYFLNKK